MIKVAGTQYTVQEYREEEERERRRRVKVRREVDQAAHAAEGSEKQVPVQRKQPKVGRNDLCLCGSGKKYKKCCGQ